MLELSQEDRELLKEAIGEERLKEIDELKVKRQEMDDSQMGIIDPREDEFDGLRSVENLMMWNLAPIESLARSIQIECDHQNYAPVDFIANELRRKVTELWDTMERWLECETEGRLSDSRKTKAPATSPEDAAAGASE